MSVRLQWTYEFVRAIRLLAILGFLILYPFFLRADALEQIRQRGTLRWGADQEGGGPYVYPRSDDPSRVTGFEVEIADLLARQLGVRAEFVQGPWDKLPDLMERGDLDIVLNGYEWSPVRGERYGCSVPYYIYELQLQARRDSTWRSMEDLRRLPGAPRHVVGVLGGTAAEDYLRNRFADDVQIVSFDGNSDAMRATELSADGVEAVLQDLPITVFMEKGFPHLRRIGDPVGRGYYVVLTPRRETALLREMNTAIRATLADGRLRQILERYGLWNDTQTARGLETDAAGYFSPLATPTVNDAPAEQVELVRGWTAVTQRGGLVVRAAGMTVLLSVISMPLAIGIGLLLALGRMYGPTLLRRFCTLYIEVIRGTPLVLQLYVIFFVLPEIGISIHAFWAAVIGLAMNYSAYEAEIYRSGIQAIPPGQTEAALALGMSRPLTIRRIIIPQATRLVIPPMTNDFIALFKDTAVCSVITVVELSKEYYIQARSTGAILELGALTSLLYLGMSYPLSVLAGRFERQLRGKT